MLKSAALKLEMKKGVVKIGFSADAYMMSSVGKMSCCREWNTQGPAVNPHFFTFVSQIG